MSQITVLLAEDHAMVRHGLKLLVEADGDIRICGEAKSGREAVQMNADLHPDVIIMDIGMPLMNGMAATRHILKDFPQARIIILSAHSDPEYVEQVVRSGACGYLIKQSAGEVLAQGIRDAHQGRTAFTPSIARRLKVEYQKGPGSDGLQKRTDHKLTSRESELLQLIAEGHLNKQIAAELSISIKTVEKHRQHLMEKLHIHDIAGLTRFAIACGIIDSRAFHNNGA